jgi:hypothetical protein
MKAQIIGVDVQSGGIEALRGEIIELGPYEVALFPPKPTPAEELLYKFVIVGASTISYMGQHERGKAYVDDLQSIFDGACKHLIARQKQGVDFAYLNPKSFTAKDAKAAK